jgi:hypothetical protein
VAVMEAVAMEAVMEAVMVDAVMKAVVVVEAEVGAVVVVANSLSLIPTSICINTLDFSRTKKIK